MGTQKSNMQIIQLMSVQDLNQYTPNQTIIFYSNFTVFQNESNQSINLINNTILPNSKNFSYPMNLILDRQVGYCGSTNQNQTYNLNKHCSLTQFSHLSKSIPNTQNYSLITSINNEFFALQNNFQIQAVNSQLQNLSNFFSYSNLNLSECLQSTSCNYTLYSICQNDNAQYLLNFTFNFQGIIVNSSTTSLPQNFQNIAKINTLLYQIFILGSQVNYQQQLYWFNQSDSSLIEISDPNSECQDFSIAQIATTINAINLDQTIIIFYIEQGNKFQLILLKQMLVQSNSITLESSFLAKSYNCENQNCSFPPSHVQILSTFYNRAIIILSDYNNNQMSQIIDFRIKQNQSLLINTIPYYGNFNNTGYSFYKNGVLMQQFSSNEINIVGAYYLNDNLYENLFEPILMQGSFNITTNNYAMIVNQQYKNGSSLYIYNDLIYNYSIGTWNITCLFNRKTQKKINVSIFCKNEFSNGTYNISFNPPILQQSSRRWIYALISIIGLLLLYFYIKVKNKTRNLEYNKYEIDL
ncbi:unnamed protein product [Paramecium sonneborni]|uniref:Transmembrane protein n=1 Tax=Paramecium sonneborni TaxID=65129 RepID=A0A8S1QZJ4_9CILI|nr:unnamed protein product [Paramecium sonneborni]